MEHPFFHKCKKCGDTYTSLYSHGNELCPECNVVVCEGCGLKRFKDMGHSCPELKAINKKHMEIKKDISKMKKADIIKKYLKLIETQNLQVEITKNLVRARDNDVLVHLRKEKKLKQHRNAGLGLAIGLLAGSLILKALKLWM